MENQDQEKESFPTLAEVEKAHLDRALEKAGGNKAQAAKLLGVSIKTVYNKLNNYYKKAEVESATVSSEVSTQQEG